MMRSCTRHNGLNPLGSLSLHPRCGKIRADVNRQIIQKKPLRPRAERVRNRLFGSGLSGLGKAIGAGLPRRQQRLSTGLLPAIGDSADLYLVSGADPAPRLSFESSRVHAKGLAKFRGRPRHGRSQVY